MTRIDLRDPHPGTDAEASRQPASLAVPVSLLMQIVLWIVAALMTYSAVNARVAVVESKVGGVEQRLDRIDGKLDRLLEERGR
jgi:hypothetical protein